MRKLLLAVALATALSACGDSDGDGGDLDSQIGAGDSTAAPSPAVQGPVAGGGASCTAGTQPGKVTTTTDPSTKPVIEVPDGPLPCELVVTDIVEGTGAATKAGDQLTMKYVGVTWASGKEFDASWGGEDFAFQLGAGGVIQGWDQGLVGMKQGGRRQLIIPPALAYGDQERGADIPANSTLIFVVDLVKIG